MDQKTTKSENLEQRLNKLRWAYNRFKIEISVLRKRQTRIIGNILKRAEQQKIDEIKRNLS